MLIIREDETRSSLYYEKLELAGILKNVAPKDRVIRNYRQSQSKISQSISHCRRYRRKEAHGIFEGRKTGIEISANYLPIEGWVIRYLFVFRCYGHAREWCACFQRLTSVWRFLIEYHARYIFPPKQFDGTSFHKKSFLSKGSTHLLTFSIRSRTPRGTNVKPATRVALTNSHEFLPFHVKNILFHSNYPRVSGHESADVSGMVAQLFSTSYFAKIIVVENCLQFQRYVSSKISVNYCHVTIKDDSMGDTRGVFLWSTTRGRTWMHLRDVTVARMDHRDFGAGTTIRFCQTRRVANWHSYRQIDSWPAMPANECRRVETLKKNYLLSPTNVNQYTRR